MTLDEASEWFKSIGWRGGDNHNSADAFWWKRFREVWPNDKGNDAKPGIQIAVSIYDCRRYGMGQTGTYFEIDLRSECPDGQWVQLKSYGIRDEEIKTVLDSECRKLIRAWVACNAEDK